ncbi:hypothetical protein GE061_015110 [Apolygus lucorum]|uniref:Odorant receptor n=1 Tax=Apolygus lucorum TaxID=248454 RepID=A0A8S9XK54_APOLU|nr:hypothetical protein GE061_015110 [Apolygus lucorum]
MVENFQVKRAQLFKVYNSIHWLTLTKWFYEDYPVEKLWSDKRLWIHLSIVIICQSSITMFKVFHLISEENFFIFLTSLTSFLVIVLVAVRTYILYQFPTFRQLYFKPEAITHSRKVGMWCLVLFITFDVAFLVLPIVPPILEIIDGTNKTYDELIPQYPSINPVSLSWLSKELKYAFDLVMAVFNTIPWVGFVVVYYTVVQLFRAQHKIMMTAMLPGPPVPGDDREPLELKLWIQDHALIRKLVYKLRNTISPALAGTICVNVFTVGLNMLALVSSPIGSDAPMFTRYLYYFSFGTYSALSIFDIFIHCWLASEITNCGEDLSYALLKSDWQNDLKRSHHHYVLPLMLCKKQIRFTGLGLIPVTLTTFTETIRVSYSYFTLLRKTDD